MANLSNASMPVPGGEVAPAVRPWLTPTFAAHAAFVPTGVVTVLLGPVLPALSSRWSLNDAQAGELFTAQFLASTVGVGVSGFLVPRFGYRLVIVLGLLCMAAGVGSLPLGTRFVGMASVACFGIGLGLTIPTCNLLVSEVNPTGRAAALSWLNFSWTLGAVACPFLLKPFQRAGRISTFFYVVACSVLLISLLLAWVSTPNPHATKDRLPTRSLAAMLRTTAAIALGTLFFVYVGTENAVGGWLASYAKRVLEHSSTVWVTAPSFFYGGLLAGRALAPMVLRKVAELRVVRASMALALLGLICLLFSRSVGGVFCSASLIGLGFAPVYPIVISLLSNVFGKDATRLGSMMFMLAGFGASCMPWLVGYVSTKMSSLAFGIGVPLAACFLMLALFLGNWERRYGEPYES
jgi:fucose permease